MKNVFRMTVAVFLISLSLGCARRMTLREDTVLQVPPQSGTRSFYDALSRHGDMIAHHFDGGVPWDEALKESPYHFRVRSEIEYRRTHTPENKRVYLAVTPLSTKRNSLAGRWGKGTNMPRAGEWKQKNFSDLEVVQAYTNYCREMIRAFEPDFMAYGIEVNMLAEKDPLLFEEYCEMAAAVYRTLKKEHPDLPLFLTLQLETFIKDPLSQKAAIEKLLPFTDYIAASSYPFLNNRRPGNLPADWFSKACRSFCRQAVRRC